MKSSFSVHQACVKKSKIPFIVVRTQAVLPFEFHVSRKARDKFQFDLSIFSTNGNVIFANFYAARLFSQKMNEQRDLLNNPESAVSAAEINAMGLIDEILHSIVAQYRASTNANVFNEALAYLTEQYSAAEIEKVLQTFVDQFPPLSVYRQEQTVAQYLAGNSNGIANREIALEEMILLWLANKNPAFARYRELFDDTELRQQTVYAGVMGKLTTFFDRHPGIGGQGKNLLHTLLMPATAMPHSLTDQLNYIRSQWGVELQPLLTIKSEQLLGETFVEKWGIPTATYETRVLRTLDYITEEQRVRFNPAQGAAPTQVVEYFFDEEEPEQFSVDLDWMPRLVLIAKSTLVWLDQLSKKYQQEIVQLDQIPEAELDELSRRGFTGLWLIGVWERSKASKRIKQMCGNPEAEASAYSLYDYEIAADLGGEAAYEVLKECCWQRGIRLGSDMVPNHTGIDSRWISDHPDWFVQLPYSPFPAYSFNGSDLSNDDRVKIQLEDHYFDRTDAAVVFRHVDKASGQIRYIYHGNDGTAMPWNDTAQLNYLMPEVREAVIQKIIGVAKKFPIIRFDAAMTLAKKHFHRLWYPEPGSGGDIPSRAEQGMPRQLFDQYMPLEFWREVVDRVAEEVPDTLLLAEAFWLMEGFFVRTLGMHRVYNSAFMHMLKKEENKKYRYTIKNTIEFEPEILKRYVNFMNNPDEDTAIAQFGDGDKYFGVCVMMATMPGLPMFGHGQVEGFREKYGMEYRKAYFEEQPNPYLLERHEREIFPLLKKRYLFAEVEHFLLYDFYGRNGRVNEDVFAYSNRYAAERTLVLFNNAFKPARGWVQTSAAFSEKNSGGKTRRLMQKPLGEGLSLSSEADSYVIFRDHTDGLQYIRHSQTLWQRGMYVELGEYKYRVFVDFQEVRDIDGRYTRLADYLQERGVPDIEEALLEMHLQPVHHAFRAVMNADSLKQLRWAYAAGQSPTPAESKVKGQKKTRPLSTSPQPAAVEPEDILDDIQSDYQAFVADAKKFEDIPADEGEIAARVRVKLSRVLELSAGSLAKRYPMKKSRHYDAALKLVDRLAEDREFFLNVLLVWAMVSELGRMGNGTPAADSIKAGPQSLMWVNAWRLNKLIANEFRVAGMPADKASRATAIIRMLTLEQDWYDDTVAKSRRAGRLLQKVLSHPEAQQFCQVNRYDGILWFNKESFEELSEWLTLLAILQQPLNTVKQPKTKSKVAGKPAVKPSKKPQTGSAVARAIKDIYSVFNAWQKAEKSSEYQLNLLLEKLGIRLKKKPASKAPTAEKGSGKRRNKSLKPKAADSSPAKKKPSRKSPAKKLTAKSDPASGEMANGRPKKKKTGK